MRTVYENSILGDVVRWSQRTVLRLMCLLGWHEWKTYRHLTIVGPQMIYDACIHCGRHKYGSLRPMFAESQQRDAS